MRTRYVRFVAAVLIVAPITVHAQSERSGSLFSLEVTGDGAFPVSTFRGADLKTGFGLGASVRARVQEHLLAYAGWEWHTFRTDNLIASTKNDVDETGYTFGLRFEHPLRNDAIAGRGRTSGPGYWIRGGGLYNHVEIENEAGSIIGDTKHGLGWELGGGLTLPLSQRFALTPGVRYRSLSRDLTLGSGTRSATLSQVNAMVGLTIAF
jgi:opacity protein-like surface antigen